MTLEIPILEIKLKFMAIQWLPEMYKPVVLVVCLFITKQITDNGAKCSSFKQMMQHSMISLGLLSDWMMKKSSLVRRQERTKPKHWEPFILLSKMEMVNINNNKN